MCGSNCYSFLVVEGSSRSRTSIFVVGGVVVFAFFDFDLLCVTGSEDEAPSLGLRLGRGTQHRADGLVEHGLEALLREGGTLEVLHGAHVLGHGETLQETKARQISAILEKVPRTMV